jgi:hypothetical protein
MKAYCQCGREWEWHDSEIALCLCGNVIEPQTEKEREERRREHLASLDRRAACLQCQRLN